MSTADNYDQLHSMVDETIKSIRIIENVTPINMKVINHPILPVSISSPINWMTETKNESISIIPENNSYFNTTLTITAYPTQHKDASDVAGATLQCS